MVTRAVSVPISTPNPIHQESNETYVTTRRIWGEESQQTPLPPSINLNRAFYSCSDNTTGELQALMCLSIPPDSPTLIIQEILRKPREPSTTREADVITPLLDTAERVAQYHAKRILLLNYGSVHQQPSTSLLEQRGFVISRGFDSPSIMVAQKDLQF